MTHSISQQLEQIQKLLETHKFAQKETLTMAEASQYTGLSRSFLYKLVSKRQITFYKLGQKLIFFKKSDLDNFILSERLVSEAELTNNL
jgi:excisionase family DNA binding protein